MKNAELNREQVRFIHDLSRVLTFWNMPLMAARVFCYLQITEYPASLDEIAAAMDTTKGNTSTAATLLEAQGCAKRITKRGSRRVLYVASGDLGSPFRKHVDLIKKMTEMVEERINAIYSEIAQKRLSAFTTFGYELSEAMNEVIARADASGDESETEDIF